MYSQWYNLNLIIIIIMYSYYIKFNCWAIKLCIQIWLKKIKFRFSVLLV